MSEDERDFLIAEYQASWDSIQNIDERRGTFVSHYAILFGGALSVVSAILAAHTDIDRQTRVGLVLILGTAVLAGIIIIGVLRSERAANVRYRHRVNRIRELFLSSSSDPAVVRYLAGEQHNPSGIGGTLKWVFAMIGIQIAAALVLAYGLWPNSG